MNINIPKLINKLYSELNKNGFEFTSEGYPIFTDDMILKDKPSQIITYEKRNTVAEKCKSVVCFYQEDEALYHILKNLDKVPYDLKNYMGIIGFDLSPAINWNIKRQKLNLLLNQLVTAYFVTMGIKVIPNWRIGSLETLYVLNSYPKNCCYGVGTLGCSKINKQIGEYFLKAKIGRAHV